MYSLVLMTAMTAGPDGPEFNGFFSNLFSRSGSCSGASCSGNCYGNYAPRYSCYGGGCSGAAAYNCTGCNGCSGSSSASNGCNGTGGFGSRVRKWFDRGGCNGSGCNGCTGSGYGCTGSGYGCTGSGYGCTGSVGYSCLGSSAYSCFGGPAVAYTPVFNGGLSCQGGMAWPAPPPMFETSPSMPAMPGMIPPATIPYAPPEAAPGLNPQNTGYQPTGSVASSLTTSGSSSRATVVVRLPVDARLFADAKALSLTGPERKFVSPELPTGQEFVYRFRAEYERDGETVSVTKKIAVRAGAVLNVEFTDLTAARVTPERIVPEKTTGGSSSVAATPTSNSSPVPATPAVTAPPVPAVVPVPTPTESRSGEPATITVKLPAGATLFVDDRKSPSSDPVRRFNTPPLPAGRDFAYLMRAEIVRNGQTESFTQKVPFRAGERVDVDFSSIGH